MVIDGVFRGDDCGWDGFIVWVGVEGDVGGREDVVEVIVRVVGKLEMMS